MNKPNIRNLGQQDYQTTWQAMRDFTDQRTATTADELWIVEHPPVFTQGQAGKKEHVINAGNIPVIQSDRGGQVTYHGPGQIVIYLLLDLRRLKLGIRQLVCLIEQAVIEYLANLDIKATARRDAPGVYVNDAKICALGLRVRKGCTYHGLAFNVDMDLEPFKRINPCGYPELAVTQLSNIKKINNINEIAEHLIQYIMSNLRYN